jgi:SAM-dependent methyltransferase
MAREIVFRNAATGREVLSARPLGRRHVEGCRVFESREAMMELIPPGGRFAELGVQQGYFADFVLKRVRPAEYHGFDLDLGQILFERFPALGAPTVRFHRGDSSAELARFPDAHFDAIYIDGDHTYPGARKDATVALRKIRPDGFLLFNDYTPWSPLENCEYGVMRVVHELCDEHGWVIAGLGLHVLGYHDVALRRPAAS